MVRNMRAPSRAKVPKKPPESRMQSPYPGQHSKPAGWDEWLKNEGGHDDMPLRWRGFRDSYMKSKWRFNSKARLGSISEGVVSDDAIEAEERLVMGEAVNSRMDGNAFVTKVSISDDREPYTDTLKLMKRSTHPQIGHVMDENRNIATPQTTNGHVSDIADKALTLSITNGSAKYVPPSTHEHTGKSTRTHVLDAPPENAMVIEDGLRLPQARSRRNSEEAKGSKRKSCLCTAIIILIILAVITAATVAIYLVISARNTQSVPVITSNSTATSSSFLTSSTTTSTTSIPQSTTTTSLPIPSTTTRDLDVTTSGAITAPDEDIASTASSSLATTTTEPTTEATTTTTASTTTTTTQSTTTTSATTTTTTPTTTTTTTTPTTTTTTTPSSTTTTTQSTTTTTQSTTITSPTTTTPTSTTTTTVDNQFITSTPSTAAFKTSTLFAEARVDFALRIQLDGGSYTTEYEQDSSQQFQDLQNAVCGFSSDIIAASNTIGDTYIGCSLFRVIQQNFIVEYDLMFNSPDSTLLQNRLVLELRSALEQSNDFTNTWLPDVNSLTVNQL